MGDRLMAGNLGTAPSLMLTLVAAAVIACSVESVPTESVPVIPPLSETSDRARVEQVLPWRDIVATCEGIDSSDPSGGFASSSETIERSAGETMNINEYAGEVWASSRLLREGSRGTDDYRLLNISITYYRDEGFVTAQLEIIDQYDYELTQSGSAVIAKSRANAAQVYVFDGPVVASFIGISSADVRPYCTETEIDTLAVSLLKGLE